MKTDKTTTTASAQPENVAHKFGSSFIGCVIDGNASSADYINRETISFAEGIGFENASDVPSDENDEDYGQILSEVADEAVSFLNEQELLPYCYFGFEDNSLFYGPSIENVKEDTDFVSTKAQEYPRFDNGEWLHVNDHGNCTLYVRKNGEDTEIWSIV